MTDEAAPSTSSAIVRVEERTLLARKANELDIDEIVDVLDDMRDHDVHLFFTTLGVTGAIAFTRTVAAPFLGDALELAIVGVAVVGTMASIYLTHRKLVERLQRFGLDRSEAKKVLAARRKLQRRLVSMNSARDRREMARLTKEQLDK